MGHRTVHPFVNLGVMEVDARGDRGHVIYSFVSRIFSPRAGQGLFLRPMAGGSQWTFYPMARWICVCSACVLDF